MRRHPPSPEAAPPLDDEDLLAEILLRLPPQPSSLPRASAVCKLWRSLASDPAFSRRFRRHHRRNPPLLGCFMKDGYEVRFEPTLDPPNRVPRARFSFPGGRHFMFLGCRHGFLLMFHTSQGALLAWDPVNGHEHPIAIQREDPNESWSGASYCPRKLPGGLDAVDPRKPAVLVGDSLYMLLVGNSSSIIEFDVDRQSLAMIPLPVGLDPESSRSYSVMRAEGGGTGLLFVSTPDCSAQLWKRKTDCDGVASWVLGRTIALDNLLSLDLRNNQGIHIQGFEEENNVVFLSMFDGVFMVQLDSLQFKKLSNINVCRLYPFECVYAAGNMLNLFTLVL
ncbi:unnamed protein product [Alopecurus aequalis]